MVEITKSLKNEILIIDASVNLQNFRNYWFEIFKNSLPNTLVFWGTAIATSLLFTFLFRNSVNLSVFLLLVSAVLFTLPILIWYFSYQNFMRVSRKYVRSLSNEEKSFTLTFDFNGEGFECLQGKNYSFIAWDSIVSASEKPSHFVLVRQMHPFLISRTDFESQSQIEAFRLLLATKLGSKVKLLS